MVIERQEEGVSRFDVSELFERNNCLPVVLASLGDVSVVVGVGDVVYSAHLLHKANAGAVDHEVNDLSGAGI